MFPSFSSIVVVDRPCNTFWNVDGRFREIPVLIIGGEELVENGEAWQISGESPSLAEENMVLAGDVVP